MLVSLGFGFHVLHLDKKNNNILESIAVFENENTTLFAKSIFKEKEYSNFNDEEKKLLSLSRLIL
jgi:hypothetical protein